MNYCPHILQVKSTNEATDEYGRIISGEDSWENVCQCRCDDNSTKEFRNENGDVYRPNFRVVCDGKVSIKAGDEIRCMNGDTVRGSGKVYLVKILNYLNYSELWM